MRLPLIMLPPCSKSSLASLCHVAQKFQLAYLSFAAYLEPFDAEFMYAYPLKCSWKAQSQVGILSSFGTLLRKSQVGLCF